MENRGRGYLGAQGSINEVEDLDQSYDEKAPLHRLATGNSSKSKKNMLH